MSEKVPKPENWKEEMRLIIREEIERNRKTSLPSSEQTEKTQKPQEHNHFNTSLAYLEDPDNCPECKAGLEKFGKDYTKKFLEERKDYPLECVECGTHVQREEEECPTCGSKEAKQR